MAATKGKQNTVREIKKMRIEKNMDEKSTSFEKGVWKKLTVLLELIQNKKKLEKKHLMISDLFVILNKSLDLDSHPSVEYIRQLTLSAIFTCCQQLGVAGLDERQFQVELIVQCIRSSVNPKTHHQSLLLLNLAASMFPDYVLSNVMSIFTFMGSSLVRQDDSYSFQVISQTIETIVPSLLEASNQQTESDGIQVVASVIRVFVDSLLDIPGHRQLPLFVKLISTLDPAKYLWIPLGQICDQYSNVFHNTAIDDDTIKMSPTLEFTLNLHKQFSLDTQIETCIKLITFLKMLPDSKKHYESIKEDFKYIVEPFNVASHSEKQLQIYKDNIILYLCMWLSSQTLLGPEDDSKEQHRLKEKYKEFLESVLSFLQHQINISVENKEIHSNLIQHLHDLVSGIHSLLPLNLFIKILRQLLKNSTDEIQKKSIDLLSVKLEQEYDSLSEENHKPLLKLLKPLLNILERYNDKYSYIQQSALYAVHLLVKLLGPEHPHKFYIVLRISINILKNSTYPELKVNALLCLAHLFHCLNVNILPHLNEFMPLIVNILHSEESLNFTECLILGVIASLQSLIENLGMFLSTYMQDIVVGACMIFAKYSKADKKGFNEKLDILLSKLADEVVLRVLLSAIEGSYSSLVQKDATSIIPLMKILNIKLNSSSYEDILSYSAQIQKFYVCLLDFRNLHYSLPDEFIELIEASVISSLEIFVMKLSVTCFKTFFQKIFQWSTFSSDDNDPKYRIFTFYKLTNQFSVSLKNLFSRMGPYFFRHAASMLDLNNFSKCNSYYFKDNYLMSNSLLINVLDTLNNCFMYSDGQFLDKENFEILMQPLIDQIENLNENERDYQNLIENHLTSCIAYFMMCVTDSSLWKTLNYQILLKTRHDFPKVRFASLQVILEVVKKMGDNYLVLLPESIPFLAEIMEDESTEVEHECRNVILEMEKILGEPIRKYF